MADETEDWPAHVSNAKLTLETEDAGNEDPEDEEYDPLFGQFTDVVITLPWEQVLEEERRLIRMKLRARCPQGRGEPFSLAFSGGGVRCAAFQAGVLWRLAQRGMLKDVEYLTAVSGGGYIASSFISHALGTEPPKHPSQVNKWYLDVVAKTVCLMQRNAGLFVRDCCDNPWMPTLGGGLCPQLCDIPILLVMLVLTLISNPTMFVVAALIPASELIDIFFGSGMRAAFCAPSNAGTIDILMKFSPLGQAWWAVVCVIGINFTIWSIGKILCAWPPAGTTRPIGYLVVQASTGFLARLVIAMSTILLLIQGATLAQRMKYELTPELAPLRPVACASFVCPIVTTSGKELEEEPCTSRDNFWGKPWFYVQDFTFEFNCTQPGVPEKLQKLEAELRSVRQNRLVSVVSLAFIFLTALTFFSIVMLPVFPTLLVNWTGPLSALLLVMLFVQFRVYGTISEQNFFDGRIHYTRESWQLFMRYSLAFGTLAIPFWNEIRSLWHWYYRRCLRQSFFEGGSDRAWSEIGASPFCPLLLFTGTVNDFKRPGDDNSLSEISFSPLHTGSVKCGYVPTPHYRSLAQTTALTGAGCLDAISLSMDNHLRTRFWLEVLNLSWGHYILFDRWRLSRTFRRCVALAGSWEQEATWALHRIPSVALWILVASLLDLGWELVRASNGDPATCSRGKELLMCSLGLSIGMVGMSFFSFFRIADFLMFSSPIRMIQQATQYFASGDKPPRMLYVTDGGVKDCTSLHQLLMRRTRKILLVLAAMDPEDDLFVLRTAMEGAVAAKLSSFFDPRDPRRDVRILLDEFKKDKSIPFLHIGIRYGWAGDKAVTFGHLFVLKNRLSPSLQGWKMPPSLTPEEIRGEEIESSDDEDWGDLLPTDLGGWGCCNCCHTSGCNCGRKFPQLTVAGYVYLSPQLFNCLCRLGNMMASPVLDAMSSVDLGV